MSLVVPEIGDTIEISLLDNKFIKLDFPTLVSPYKS